MSQSKNKSCIWSVFNKQNSIIESAQKYDKWRDLVIMLAEGRAPHGLSVDGDLSLAHLRIRSLPQNMTIHGTLDLRQCQRLARIGDNMVVHGDLLMGGRCGKQPEYQKQLVQDSQIPFFLKKLSKDGSSPLKSLPKNLTVKGDLLLRSCSFLEELPENLKIRGSLLISRCNKLKRIPDSLGLSKGLYIIGCQQTGELPKNLKVRQLAIIGGIIDSLPDNLDITGTIHIENCPNLKKLPLIKGLDTGVSEYFGLKKCPVSNFPEKIDVTDKIVLSDLAHREIRSDLKARSVFIEKCRNLEHVSGKLDAGYIVSLRNNTRLKTFPASSGETEVLDLENCESLETLPDSLIFSDSRIGNNMINIKNCRNLKSLPDNVFFNGRMEISGSGLNDIPKKMSKCRLMWQEHWVNSELMFHPEKLTPDRILTETNAEIRRLMLEKVGIDKVLSKADVVVTDQDEDPGGKRSLIIVRVKIRGREFKIRFLRCCCPSSGREYLLSVPERICSCHAAAAWIAGFEKPSEYRPVQET